MQVLFVFLFWLATLFSGSNTATTSAKQHVKSIVPVKLLAFKGKTDGNVNILEWHTTAEVNTREFIIETSADGNDLRPLIWVTPKGSAHGPTFYRYTDTTAGTQAYYRLRMVDADGKEQVSKIIAVKRQPVAKS
ncbi:MAG TPA: hypothetical protein VD993_06500 [Chitinophagaceae bacterium]|nr:hypothetical protein [Chitinophagaceae bacterium]